MVSIVRALRGWFEAEGTRDIRTLVEVIEESVNR